MHTDKITIQKSVKAYLNLNTNEAQVEVHVFTLKEHISLLHQK